MILTLFGQALINNKKEREIKDKFNNDAYYRNFVALSRDLAPDGDNIKLVGLSVQREGGERKVAFERVRKEMMSIPLAEIEDTEDKAETKTIQIKGTLTYADALKKKIKLTTDDGKRWDVKVPEGLSDIVKPYWEESVIVWGIKTGPKKIVLENIDKWD